MTVSKLPNKIIVKPSVFLICGILLTGLLLSGCGRNDSGRSEPMYKKLGIEANIVFFYYKDLDGAKRFYEDIIGLQGVLDYGFAKVYRISRTSYVGLVDESEGMHRATEPKSVTLSFITQEIDEWYNYLVEQGVEMRGPIGSSTRHPTRGFVAYDPEGYFLEFETFLDDPQNTKLNALLSETEALYPGADNTSNRPGSLGFHGNVIWLYYKDIPGAQRFYEENFGFELLVDQGFAKVYTSSPTCFVGLVDESQGLHRFAEEKAVTVAFITESIDEWYDYLKSRGLKMRGPLSDSEREPIRAFVTYDTAGYFLEFDKFYDHEQNRELLRILKTGDLQK